MIKKAHFYWGGEKLSYFRYLTFLSFQKQNPDWEINFWKPKTIGARPQWATLEHTAERTYNDWMPRLLEDVKMEIHVLDFNELDFDCHAPEGIKSDFAQWYVLFREGGLWLDTDIVFFKPIPELNVDFALTADDRDFYIAYVYAQPQLDCMERLHLYSRQVYDPDDYQCLGNNFLKRFFRFEDLGCSWAKLDPKIILPIIRIKKIGDIFSKGELPLEKPIGIHWFGGHTLATQWENLLKPESLQNYETCLIKKIREVV